jgi:hypothetical protein
MTEEAADLIAVRKQRERKRPGPNIPFKGTC